MIEQVKRILGLSRRKTGNKLVISVEKLERRVALLENGRLEEYSVERDSSRNIVGSVYKGRVKNIEMGSRRCSSTSASRKMPSSISGTPFPPRSTAASRKSSGPSDRTGNAEKAPHGQGHSEHLSGRLRSHRAGDEGPDRDERPARHDQSELRRSLPGVHALQRSQRHLAQDRRSEGTRRVCARSCASSTFRKALASSSAPSAKASAPAISSATCVFCSSNGRRSSSRSRTSPRLPRLRRAGSGRSHGARFPYRGNRRSHLRRSRRGRADGADGRRDFAARQKPHQVLRRHRRRSSRPSASRSKSTTLFIARSG